MQATLIEPFAFADRQHLECVGVVRDEHDACLDLRTVNGDTDRPAV